MRPKVYCKKHKSNPGNGDQQKTTIYCGTQSYCVICANSGYPECRYKSNSSYQFNLFNYDKTNKELDDNLYKSDASTKNFGKNSGKIFNQINALNKHNNMMFKLSKKISTHRDLNKIDNINKEIYYYLRSKNSSVSSRSDSSYSSISPLID